MNRYLIEGLIRDLHAGNTVVVIAPSMAQSRHAFMAVTSELEVDDSVAKILRGNGRECIEMRNGARLRTIAANCNGGRGFNADIVVVLGWEYMSDNQRDAVLGYHGATRAEIIRL